MVNMMTCGRVIRSTLTGVCQWQAANEHLFDEAVDASHDDEKGIGDEPENGRWHHLADHQPIDDTEELHWRRP